MALQCLKMGKIQFGNYSDTTTTPGFADASGVNGLLSTSALSGASQPWAWGTTTLTGLSPLLPGQHLTQAQFLGPYTGYTPTAQELADAHFNQQPQQWGPFTVSWITDNPRNGTYVAQAVWTNGPPTGYDRYGTASTLAYTYQNGVGGEYLPGVGFEAMSKDQYASLGQYIGSVGIGGACAISLMAGGWLGVAGCAFGLMAGHDDLQAVAQDWLNSYTDANYNLDQQYSDGLYLGQMAQSGNDTDAGTRYGEDTTNDYGQDTTWAGQGDRQSWDNNGQVIETFGQNNNTPYTIKYDGGGARVDPHQLSASLHNSQASVKMQTQATTFAPSAHSDIVSTYATTAAGLFVYSGKNSTHAGAGVDLHGVSGYDWGTALGEITHATTLVHSPQNEGAYLRSADGITHELLPTVHAAQHLVHV